MNFLGNIEQEFSNLAPTNRSAFGESSRLAPSVEESYGPTPREAYSKVRERMIELELEKEEQQKALDMVKKLRVKEREELCKRVDLAKEEG